jgi:hypothetical protein
VTHQLRRDRRAPQAVQLAENELQKDGFFEAVALDWEAPTGADGTPLPFTAEGRAEMLDVPGFPPALELAFWQMLGAIVDDRAGNSNASRAGGPVAGEATADPAPTKPI